jgi:hypothetical protein
MRRRRDRSRLKLFYNLILYYHTRCNVDVRCNANFVFKWPRKKFSIQRSRPAGRGRAEIRAGNIKRVRSLDENIY